jgi:mono/diheme cytochrome c family protein
MRWTIVAVLIMVGATSGCGPTRGGPTPTTEPIPTPRARFEQPTTVIQASAATTTPAAAVGDPDLAQGQRILESKCSTCHGAKGEGIADKGKALAGTSLSLQEFEDILRTGGKGRLGSEHIFGPSQISPSGIRALHAYLQSLPAP